MPAYREPEWGESSASRPSFNFAVSAQHLPGYRYLVAYLNFSPFAVDRALRQVSRGRKGCLRKLRARPDRLLVLARILMMDENARARQNPDVKRSLEAISEQWGVDEDDLLSWSFVPREVLGLLKVRLAVVVEKKADAREVRRLRQLQIRQPEIYGEVPILTGRKLRDHERPQWALNFGLDKKADEVSRQRIWGEVEVGLCKLLRQNVIDAGMRSRSGPSDNEGPPRGKLMARSLPGVVSAASRTLPGPVAGSPRSTPLALRPPPEAEPFQEDLLSSRFG